MQKPTISAIAAVGQNLELGKKNELIWRIPADLKRVKELTTGHPIIMGRNTYESIGRPLPNRTNIVITKNADYEAPGCIVVTSLEEALEEAGAVNAEEIFIFGGASIYKEALPITDKLHLTEIDASDSEADSFFPEYKSEFVPHETPYEESHEGLRYRHVTYMRKT
tara:strand:- start:2782 stop:3279 length:498 start_codon:yes stop_codon:yes gene_type:complete